MGKDSSLLWTFLNHGRKKFYNIGLRSKNEAESVVINHRPPEGVTDHLVPMLQNVLRQ
jgi:hypothetical protein